MTTVFETYSDHTAPPGHVTFSVLDQAHCGHSVSVAAKEYPGVVRATKIGIGNRNRATAFKGAIEIIRRSVGCTCEDDELLYAFIIALLKHPVKRSRRKLMAGIRTTLKKEGGAHVILYMPPVGPSAWMVGGPSSNGHVR